MTVAAETEEGPVEYEQVRFVEFLEMIGRAAQLKFEGTPLDKSTPLEKKVFIIVEALLKKEGIVATMPDNESATESETDDDY